MSELEKKTEITEEIAEPVPTLVTPPVVFLVNDTYQIIFETDINAWAYAEIGGKIYKDSINGVVRSADTFHKAIIPIRLPLLQIGATYIGCSPMRSALYQL